MVPGCISIWYVYKKIHIYIHVFNINIKILHVSTIYIKYIAIYIYIYNIHILNIMYIHIYIYLYADWICVYIYVFNIRITDKIIVILSYSWFALAFLRLHKPFTTNRGRPYTDTPFVISPGVLNSSQPLGGP